MKNLIYVKNKGCLMQVLLSVEPKYVQSIFNGTKKYEFRKTAFKTGDVRTALIYSSSPEKKIVGVFEVGGIIKNNPKELWNICKNQAGIGEKEFFNFFKGFETGYAIKIDSVKKFEKKIDPYRMYPGFRPPPSHYYYDYGKLSLN